MVQLIVVFGTVHLALGVGTCNSPAVLGCVASSSLRDSLSSKVGRVIDVRFNKTLSLSVEVIHVCVVRGEGRPIGFSGLLWLREVLVLQGRGGLMGLLGFELGVLLGGEL